MEEFANSPSEYNLKNEEMNNYKKAIERNEVRDFFFGYGEYYHHDRDWGTHDNISTFIDILDMNFTISIVFAIAIKKRSS